MPSARDLMEKADSLMKSNRHVGAVESDADVPVLTDIAVPGNATGVYRAPREDFQSVPPPLPPPLRHVESPAPSPTIPLNAGVAEPVDSKAEIAETVYFQVLQNLDLYTEVALQEHLSAHLAPIIDRASSEMLLVLNAKLGAMIRQFVADAIEKQLGVRPDTNK